MFIESFNRKVLFGLRFTLKVSHRSERKDKISFFRFHELLRENFLMEKLRECQRSFTTKGWLHGVGGQGK